MTNIRLSPRDQQTVVLKPGGKSLWPGLKSDQVGAMAHIEGMTAISVDMCFHFGSGLLVPGEDFHGGVQTTFIVIGNR